MHSSYGFCLLLLETMSIPQEYVLQGYHTDDPPLIPNGEDLPTGTLTRLHTNLAHDVAVLTSRGYTAFPTVNLRTSTGKPRMLSMEQNGYTADDLYSNEKHERKTPKFLYTLALDYLTLNGIRVDSVSERDVDEKQALDNIELLFGDKAVNRGNLTTWTWKLVPFLPRGGARRHRTRRRHPTTRRTRIQRHKHKQKQKRS